MRQATRPVSYAHIATSTRFRSASFVIRLAMWVFTVLRLMNKDPPLEPVGSVFGLGLIVWFTLVAMNLIREPVRSGA